MAIAWRIWDRVCSGTNSRYDKGAKVNWLISFAYIDSASFCESFFDSGFQIHSQTVLSAMYANEKCTFLLPVKHRKASYENGGGAQVNGPVDGWFANAPEKHIAIVFLWFFIFANSQTRSPRQFANLFAKWSSEKFRKFIDKRSLRIVFRNRHQNWFAKHPNANSCEEICSAVGKTDSQTQPWLAVANILWNNHRKYFANCLNGIFANQEPRYP